MSRNGKAHATAGVAARPLQLLPSSTPVLPACAPAHAKLAGHVVGCGNHADAAHGKGPVALQAGRQAGGQAGRDVDRRHCHWQASRHAMVRHFAHTATLQRVQQQPRKGPTSCGWSSSSTAAKKASMSTCSQVRVRSRPISSSARRESMLAVWPGGGRVVGHTQAGGVGASRQGRRWRVAGMAGMAQKRDTPRAPREGMRLNLLMHAVLKPKPTSTLCLLSHRPGSAVGPLPLAHLPARRHSGSGRARACAPASLRPQPPCAAHWRSGRCPALMGFTGGVSWPESDAMQTGGGGARLHQVLWWVPPVAAQEPRSNQTDMSASFVESSTGPAHPPCWLQAQPASLALHPLPPCPPAAEGAREGHGLHAGGSGRAKHGATPARACAPLPHSNHLGVREHRLIADRGRLGGSTSRCTALHGAGEWPTTRRRSASSVR